MLHNDAAQQRPGEKPASEPEASQKSTRTQGQANFKIQTLKRISSRPGDTTAASLTDGNMDTPHIIHIHGRHSPPAQLDLTTHAIKQRLQRPQGSTKILRQQPTSLPWLADTIPSGKDTCQPARSSDLSRGQSKDSCPCLRLRICSKIRNKATMKRRATLRLQQQLNTHTPHC